MMVLQAVPCCTPLEVSWTSHCEQATLHYIDIYNKNQIFGTADGKVHQSVFGNSLDILRAIVFKPRSHHMRKVLKGSGAKLFYCPKEHHKLQYDECMETKKNNAVVADVNHPTSTLTPTKDRIDSTSESSSPRCTKMINTVLLAKDTCPVNKMTVQMSQRKHSQISQVSSTFL